MSEIVHPAFEKAKIMTAFHAVNMLVDLCHSASRNAGWWVDAKTGRSIKENPYYPIAPCARSNLPMQ